MELYAKSYNMHTKASVDKILNYILWFSNSEGTKQKLCEKIDRMGKFV